MKDCPIIRINPGLYMGVGDIQADIDPGNEKLEEILTSLKKRGMVQYIVRKKVFRLQRQHMMV